MIRGKFRINVSAVTAIMAFVIFLVTTEVVWPKSKTPNYTISGVITDKDTGLGASGIIMEARASGYAFSSDPSNVSGNYNIIVTRTGSFTVSAIDEEKPYVCLTKIKNPNPEREYTVDIKNSKPVANGIDFEKYEIQEAEDGFQKPCPNYNPDKYGYTFGQLACDKYKIGCIYHPGQDYNVDNDQWGNTPIYSVAKGVVVARRPKRNNSWGGIVIKHLYRGEIYYSQYGHIEEGSIPNNVQIGTHLEKNTLIGHIGDVGAKGQWHLHFEIRTSNHPLPYDRDYFYGYPNGGIRDRSNVYEWYEHPDAFIESSGAYTNTPTIVIDERELLYEGEGTGEIPFPSRWFSMNDEKSFSHVPIDDQIYGFGYGGHMQYAKTVEGGSPTAWGEWHFEIERAGKYEIKAYIPRFHATSQNANYYIDGTLISPPLDQSGINDDWKPLGTGAFNLTVGFHSIRLNNNTGESGKELAFDAIKVVYTGDIIAPWPMFGHDAQHTGQSPYIGPRASHLSWPPLDLRNGGVESGSPVLDAEGVIYVNEGYGRNTLYAISPDGTVKWQANRDVWGANSSAIGIDGTIYTPTHLGNSDHLWAFDKSSGNYIWSYPISAGSTEPIVSPEGIIYIGDKTGLYAFNADRTLKWKRDISSYYGMDVTPAIANDGSIIIVSVQQGFSTLYSVDKENLKINWSLDINDSFYIGFPVIHSDGTIYVYGTSGNLYSVSASGQLANNKWPLKISFSNWSTLAIGVDGTVYVGTTSGQGDGALYVLYPSGDVKWVYPTGMVVGPPAIDADGTIYFGSGRYPERNPGDSRITALKPDGSLLWEYFTTPLEGCETFYPAIAADGTLYVSACGFLYAFKD